MNSNWKFFWGAVGAFAAEWLKFQKMAAGNHFPESIPLQVVISLGLIMVGGFWSVATEPESKLMAFYHGATAPVLISALMH